MIIGASLGGFKGLTLEQSMQFYLRLSDEFKLSAVEIRFEREGKGPALWPWEVHKGIRDFLKNFEVRGAHLPFVYINPISPNSYIKEVSIDQLKQAIEKASGLDMDYLVMHARGLNYALTRQQEFEEWRKVVEEIIEFAEKNSILLTLENADFLHDLSLLAKMVKEINSKWLKITLDIGHAHIRKVAPLSTYPIKDITLRALDALLPLFLAKKNMPYEAYNLIENFIKSELDLISVIHIHDYNGRHDHLPIGEGKINFSFLSKLEEFKGPFILEVELENHYEDFKKSYLRFRRLMGR